ncbi:unnamed protein product [Blepharisma stoltei]|uniref:Calmodulin n=1 Tax=Blepharisma stoltei TaxID=1481888 RepID=A0AAU9KBX8_9CILI|nr:unnamed protein product [Blepharisma stoltei]
MGGVLNNMTYQKPLISPALQRLSIPKLRELHTKMINLSMSFAMTYEEFKEIFNESDFNVWDTDSNGVIEGLEVLAGLVLFADACPDDKVQFLFNLFDFNREDAISRTDLQLLAYVTLTSVCKILGYSRDINIQEPSQTVANYFHSNVKINFSALLEFCLHSQQVTQLLTVVNSSINNRSQSHS